MKLSIITINLNNREGLKKTIESVFAQTFKDFEYIVIDGGSTDGSRELIEQNADRFAYWVREPDSGIYNAMNKGIVKAKGEYVLMLNSGDWLANENVLESMVPHLDGTDIVQGNLLISQDGEWLKISGYGRSDLTFRDAYNGVFLHQASFIRKALHDQYGLYDETWRIAGDTAFFLKTLGFGDATFKYVDVTVSYAEPWGLSSNTTPYWKRIHQEEDERYDALLPPRLLRMCKEEEKKVKLYDDLHENRLIWKCVMALRKLAELWGAKKK